LKRQWRDEAAPQCAPHARNRLARCLAPCESTKLGREAALTGADFHKGIVPDEREAPWPMAPHTSPGLYRTGSARTLLQGLEGGK